MGSERNLTQRRKGAEGRKGAVEYWVFGCWTVLWIGSAFNTVNSTPYMMMAAREAERRHAFAAQSAMIAFMGFAGGAVAGMLPGLFAVLLGTTLDGPGPYRAALWVAPLSYLLTVFVMAGASPMKLTGETAQRSGGVAPIGLFVFLGVIVFLQTAGDGAARAFFNVYLDTELGVDTVQIGAIMGVGQLLPVFVALTTPALLNRWGTERTLVVAGLGLGTALTLLGLVPNWLVAGLYFAAIVSMAVVGGTSRNLFSQERHGCMSRLPAAPNCRRGPSAWMAKSPLAG